MSSFFILWKGLCGVGGWEVDIEGCGEVGCAHMCVGGFLHARNWEVVWGGRKVRGCMQQSLLRQCGPGAVHPPHHLHIQPTAPSVALHVGPSPAHFCPVRTQHPSDRLWKNAL